MKANEWASVDKRFCLFCVINACTHMHTHKTHAFAHKIVTWIFVIRIDRFHNIMPEHVHLCVCVRTCACVCIKAIKNTLVKAHDSAARFHDVQVRVFLRVPVCECILKNQEQHTLVKAHNCHVESSHAETDPAVYCHLCWQTSQSSACSPIQIGF